MTLQEIEQLNKNKNLHKGSMLYEDADHKFLWLGMEKEEVEGIVNVNQYLIIPKGKGILLDAGGISVFPQIVSNLSQFISISDLDILFYSHQDPDVCSGISLWEHVCSAKFYIGMYWTQFLPHLGTKDFKRVVPIPDEGMRISLGGSDFIEMIPTHFLHSVCNFTIYDSRSKYLFSGDIGAALFPTNGRYVVVEDFAAHTKLMQGFHQRFMASNKACKKWVETLAKYEINAIVPQHGAIFFEKNVQNFLLWFSNLKCGVDFL